MRTGESQIDSRVQSVPKERGRAGTESYQGSEP